MTATVRPRAGAIATLAAWTAFLVLAVAALHALDGGDLAAPPARGFGLWLAERDAATAAFALLRLVALALGWYLLASTLVAFGLRLVRADGAAGAVEACAPPLVRRLVRGAAGISIAASALAVTATIATSSSATPASAAASESVTMRLLDGADDAVVMRRLDDDDAGDVTMRRLDDAPSREATWTVEPGDSLWSISERTLTAAWKRAPTDREIDPYWRALVEHNRPTLHDPDNPDLLFPAQVIGVPAPPRDPTGS
jgi:hypothetical protein